MAQKRMFALSVVESDTFVDMPTSAQALYFHLGMHGDGYYRHIEFYDNVTVGQVFKEKRRILSEIKRQQNMEPIANGDTIPTAIKRNQA